MKKQTSSKLAAATITIVLIVILLSQIEVADVLDTLNGIEPVYLLAGFGLYILSYFFRASSGEYLASDFNGKSQRTLEMMGFKDLLKGTIEVDIKLWVGDEKVVISKLFAPLSSLKKYTANTKPMLLLPLRPHHILELRLNSIQCLEPY